MSWRSLSWRCAQRHGQPKPRGRIIFHFKILSFVKYSKKEKKILFSVLYLRHGLEPTALSERKYVSTFDSTWRIGRQWRWCSRSLAYLSGDPTPRFNYSHRRKASTRIQQSMAFLETILAFGCHSIPWRHVYRIRTQPMELWTSAWSRHQVGKDFYWKIRNSERYVFLGSLEFVVSRWKTLLLGDRVAICSRNSPEFLIAFWACRTLLFIFYALRKSKHLNDRSYWRCVCTCECVCLPAFHVPEY